MAEPPSYWTWDERLQDHYHDQQIRPGNSHFIAPVVYSTARAVMTD